MPQLSQQDIRKNKRLGLPNQRAANKVQRGRAVVAASCALDDFDDGLDDDIPFTDDEDEDYSEELGLPQAPAAATMEDTALWKQPPTAAAKQPRRKRAGRMMRKQHRLHTAESKLEADLWLRGFVLRGDASPSPDTQQQLAANIEAMPLSSFEPDSEEDAGMGSPVSSSVLFEQLFEVRPRPSTTGDAALSTSFVEHIPYDCWNIIAGFLKAHSLLCLGATNSYYRTILEECEAGWAAAWSEAVLFPQVVCYESPHQKLSLEDERTGTMHPWLELDVEYDDGCSHKYRYAKRTTIGSIHGRPFKYLAMGVDPEKIPPSVSLLPPPKQRKYPWSYYWSFRHAIHTSLFPSVTFNTRGIGGKKGKHIVETLVTAIEDELNGVEVNAYLDLYHRADGNEAVRDFARIHLNRCRGMHCTAFEMALAFNRTALSSKTARLLRAPQNDAEWEALISPLRVLSLGCDASKERDVTKHLTSGSTFVPHIEHPPAFNNDVELLADEPTKSSNHTVTLMYYVRKTRFGFPEEEPKTISKFAVGRRTFKMPQGLKPCPQVTSAQRRLLKQLRNGSNYGYSGVSDARLLRKRW